MTEISTLSPPFAARAGGFVSSLQNIVTHPNLTTDILRPNVALIADFNNDRSADIARLGTNFIFQTHSFQLYEADCFRRGRPDTIDYIGSERHNFASWQPQTGRWTYTDAAAPQTSFSIFLGSGALGDIPVPADFDGDGQADVAVFRPSEGTWYYQRSSDNVNVSARFGQAGDIPLPTDVDGDGRADFNLFRPSATVFYFASSFDGRNSFVSRGQGGIPQPTSGFFINNFYTYHPSDGAWFGDSIITQTPPNEIPVSYVLPVGN